MAERKAGARARLDALMRVEGVTALPPQASRARGLSPGGPGTAEGAVERGGLAPDEAAAFEASGWSFATGPARGDAGEAGMPVYRDADGLLKIASGGLTVRFDADVDPDRIAALLADHGLEIRRKLGFAPNLFTVSGQAGTAAGGTDAVALARRLSEADIVDYAEPVLVEPAAKR
jgi:hypothetical protein